MAGTVTLSRTQQFNITTGELLRGGRLYFYQSGTTTPQNAYTSAALTTPLANPLTLESDARVPFLWFADGSIKISLTDSSGVVQFTDDNIPIVGSSGEGGGVDTTDANAIFTTGDIKFRVYSGTLAGWIRLNSRTIGSATSGASERANADVEALYLYKWATFVDGLAPVTGGRGVSAAADWAANKPMGTLDLRGRSIFGLDGMGNTVASRLTTAFTALPDFAGATGGTERHTLGIPEIPAITPAGTVEITDTGHPHPFPASSLPTNVGAGTTGTMIPVGSTNTGSAMTGITAGFTGTSFGGGLPHLNMPPAMLVSWYMRL